MNAGLDFLRDEVARITADRDGWRRRAARATEDLDKCMRERGTPRAALVEIISLRSLVAQHETAMLKCIDPSWLNNRAVEGAHIGNVLAEYVDTLRKDLEGTMQPGGFAYFSEQRDRLQRQLWTAKATCKAAIERADALRTDRSALVAECEKMADALFDSSHWNDRWRFGPEALAAIARAKGATEVGNG